MRRTFVWMGSMLLVVSAVSPAVAQQSRSNEQVQQRIQTLMQRTSRTARWWAKPGMVEQIALTEEQVARLDAAAEESQEQRRIQSREYAMAYASFLMVLSTENIDKTTVSERRENLETTRGRIFATSVDQLFDVREILTIEQWEKLREIHPAALQLGQLGLRGYGAGTRSGGNAPQPD